MLPMAILQVFLCVDPSLGKVDKASLSNQILMELFIGSIENRGGICGHDGDVKDIGEWPGVALNESNDVTAIEWRDIGLAGAFDPKWLPETVERLLLYDNAFSGPVDLTCFPENLQEIDLSGNSLTGDIE